jgi:hypothetical protein
MQTTTTGKGWWRKTFYIFDSLGDAIDNAPGIIKSLKNTRDHWYQIDKLKVKRVEYSTECLLLEDEKRGVVFSYNPLLRRRSGIQNVREGDVLSISGFIGDIRYPESIIIRKYQKK